MDISKLARSLSRNSLRILRTGMNIAKQDILTARAFASNILVPLGVMSFYLVAFSWLLPDGVNKIFVTISGQYVFTITFLLCIAFFAMNGLQKAQQQHPKASRQNEWSAGDLWLLLLPMAPTVQYILSNCDILSGFESVLVFCSFALFASLLVLVIPLLLRGTGSVRPLMSVGLAFAFSITPA